MNQKDRAEYNRQYYLKNRDRVINEALRRQKENKEKVNLRNKVWREKNREKALESARKSYLKRGGAEYQREYQRCYRKEHPEKTRIQSRERMRRWRERNPERAKTKNMEYFNNRKQMALEYSQKYSKKNRMTKRAQLTVYRALKQGQILKYPCFICGNIKVEAHHPNYEKPLELVWLCAKHHRREHVWLD